MIHDDKIFKNRFRYNEFPANLKIPTEYEAVERGAFWGSSRLESVEIPEGVERIEDNTFRNCQNLVSVRLPASLKYIFREYRTQGNPSPART